MTQTTRKRMNMLMVALSTSLIFSIAASGVSSFAVDGKTEKE
ncbi:hypothetical protein ACRW9N_00025 [Listeria aquatica]